MVWIFPKACSKRTARELKDLPPPESAVMSRRVVMTVIRDRTRWAYPFALPMMILLITFLTADQPE